MASYKVNPDISEHDNLVELVNISNDTTFKGNELTFSEINLIPGANITSITERNSTVRVTSTPASIYGVDNVVKYRRINLPTQMEVLGFANYQLKLKEADLSAGAVFDELDTLVRLHRRSLIVDITSDDEKHTVSVYPVSGNTIYLGKLEYFVPIEKVDIHVITDLGDLTNIQVMHVGDLGNFTNIQVKHELDPNEPVFVVNVANGFVEPEHGVF